MPFYGAEYDPSGFTTPCCLLPKNADIKQLQEEMLDNKRPTACQKCWVLEDQDKTSDRQLKNSAFDFYSNKDIRFVEEDCRNGKFSTQIVKLYTSNLCNSTCVTCGPEASTAWATLKKIKTFIKIDSTILSTISVKDIVMLNFVGGEPFYEKKNFELLEQLIFVNNTNCFISFTTNGSSILTDHQKNILSKFKNLNICLSIDGIEKRFEYMRFPLKWHDLLDTIDYFKSINAQLSVSYTISNVNILYYDETVNWFKEKDLQHNHIIVSHPSYFSPDTLPANVKEQLSNILVLNIHLEQHDTDFVKTCEEIKQQDILKKINIKDYMPEFYELIPDHLR